MREDERTATPCPRCGQPIVWTWWPANGLDRLLEVLFSQERAGAIARSCRCMLSADEWDELEDAAVEALEEGDWRDSGHHGGT